MKEGKGFLKVYTRQPDQASYPPGLAYSIHMAVSTDGREYNPLNKNYGILFAKAAIRQDNTISPKGVKDPGVVELGGGLFGIVARQVHENGEADEGCLRKCLLWKTRDFISFEDPLWLTEEETGKMETATCLEISWEILAPAVEYWNPVFNTEIQVPESVEVCSGKELDQVKATVFYSDGSFASQKVVWEKSGIDFSVLGTYQVKGTVTGKQYPFPLAKGYGDPVIFSWEGKWYYTSTNDNVDDIGLYVRESDTVEGLFGENDKEHLILGQDKDRGLVQTFWAPEFHVIGGELYLLFAVSGQVWGPQCHLMKLKKGCPITNAGSWEDPVRVIRKDGGWLGGDGITLDMTYLKTHRESYMVWSYRKGMGTPGDTGSMLYIASVDDEEPWRLTSEPVLLSRPLFGWENVNGTVNNEGPYVFLDDGKVYLTYSGGAANGYTYAVGLLMAGEMEDLLDVSVWRKRCAPALSFYSVEGEYGPGHNSFFVDEEGDLMIAYHGETGLSENLRCNGIRRVHFRKDGSPEFGMSAKEELDPALCRVEIKVFVR